MPDRTVIMHIYSLILEFYVNMRGICLHNLRVLCIIRAYTNEEDTLMKKILALICAFCMILGCAAFADTLTMGTNAAFPPYEYYEDGVIVGIDAEIAFRDLRKTGIRPGDPGHGL